MPEDFMPSLFSYISVCKNDLLKISIEAINFKVMTTGLWIYEEIDTICNQKLERYGFGTNRNIKGLTYKNNSFSKKCFNSRLGKIEVYQQLGCDDTGRNPFKIIQNGKTLSFNIIGNLVFFEFDSDNDGKEELYILNYFICEGRLEIYKIDDK
jgi:hypothetical protein